MFKRKDFASIKTNTIKGVYMIVLVSVPEPGAEILREYLKTQETSFFFV